MVLLPYSTLVEVVVDQHKLANMAQVVKVVVAEVLTQEKVLVLLLIEVVVEEVAPTMKIVQTTEVVVRVVKV